MYRFAAVALGVLLALGIGAVAQAPGDPFSSEQPAGAATLSPTSPTATPTAIP